MGEERLLVAALIRIRSYSTTQDQSTMCHLPRTRYTVSYSINYALDAARLSIISILLGQASFATHALLPIFQLSNTISPDNACIYFSKLPSDRFLCAPPTMADVLLHKVETGDAQPLVCLLTQTLLINSQIYCFNIASTIIIHHLMPAGYRLPSNSSYLGHRSD